MPIGRRNEGGHSSVRKIATPMPTGTAIAMAMTEVTTRAEDRRAGAEFLGDRIPNLCGEEAEAERLKRRDRTLDQRHDHAAEDQQNDERARLASGGERNCRRQAKRLIARCRGSEPLEPATSMCGITVSVIASKLLRTDRM